MAYAVCPDCGEDIRVRASARLRDLVVCSGCGARLEVVELDPVVLDYEFGEDDDWDDYEDEDEDDDDY